MLCTRNSYNLWTTTITVVTSLFDMAALPCPGDQMLAAASEYQNGSTAVKAVQCARAADERTRPAWQAGSTW